MKLSFPYMGPTIVYAKLLELLGHDIVMPPRPNQEVIDLGVKYSPEFACFPFKVITGTYLKLMEEDVDTFVTSGGHGPCRAGYYGEAHKRILADLGYDVEMIIIDAPSDDYKYFYNILKKLKGNNSWIKVLQTINIVYKMAQALDELERKVEILRAYNKNSKFNKIWMDIEKNFYKIKNLSDVKNLKAKYIDKLSEFNNTIPAEKERYRIGIVGEIFVVLEKSINYQIEEKVNYFGFETERSQYLSEWIKENIIPFAGRDLEKIANKGREFIEINIGGHARENIGHILDFKERGFDGIIHLKPFACLPELISQSVADSISEKYDIPILTISIDEQTADANILTRIEAFLDMIREKRYREVV
ncbi:MULTISPECIES: 2-hydroxyacyl-CoA dehydratase [unclassified Halanaerobium]|uniref:2-hydroxyacyl-CoA dehydratase n=1 Tax=unclassified Halanaerobium TaxID=2641197 RepID=UPI000DF26459|nr:MULTISPECIES: 2-hydroxyacyl-CoA dehydratase [unclassified Halanaerobium]RCW41241.1 putative nucleotide-binding protein (sugar kinase/HSP70/actin superfamily) [Halanaerobium sp. MA284_MarDTE_T2]RCW81109.1 putative nucleotide-binding protein (sugar kinase/HSP70/actin superfamily) [Halanaerobium sp. DL-01]